MDAVKPLDGITVVDLTHLLAGPFCTMLLADAGATVLKIEPPAGEISRHRLPFYTAANGETVSAYFAAVNRGKYSLAMDLKSPVGRRALEQLLGRADVIVMNYREKALTALDIEPERLRETFPRAVVASITAFGRAPRGPETARPGLAIVAEAESGVTSLSRGDGETPSWVGFALGDFVAGQTAFGAISASLVQAATKGIGCYLDLSMTDALLAFNGIDLVREQAIGSAPATHRSSPVPYGVFPSADGHVVIGCNSDEFWKRLRWAMEPDRDAAAVDEFATATARMERREQVIRLVSLWTKKAGRAQVLARLIEAGVPCGPVNSAADVLGFRFFHERGSLGITEVAGDHLTLPQGSLGMAVAPPGQTPWLPSLGQHTASMLRAFTDLSPEEIDDIAAQRDQQPVVRGVAKEA